MNETTDNTATEQNRKDAYIQQAREIADEAILLIKRSFTEIRRVDMFKEKQQFADITTTHEQAGYALRAALLAIRTAGAKKQMFGGGATEGHIENAVDALNNAKHFAGKAGL